MDATDFTRASPAPTSSSPARAGSTPRPPSARPRSGSRAGPAAGVPCIAVGGGVEVEASRRSAAVGAVAVPVVERAQIVVEAMAAGIEPVIRCGKRLARLVQTLN